MNIGERKFTVILEPDERVGYAVHCPALPGCSSQGEDREDALAMIKEAIELVLEVIEERKLREPDLEFVLVETPDLLAEEVREILEYRVECDLPLIIEFAEVTVSTAVPA